MPVCTYKCCYCRPWNSAHKRVDTSCRIAGALSSVFAMALTVVIPGMTSRIGGVLTYGQPRVGDDDYASIFDDKFDGVTL
jgi:Lipase (class 3)